ncbi:hypothetical protein M2451_003824 [Dysgonomonas sp. PFB1-18]|uniref:DUF3408 domain-containing protein n=1 Tax=unclassified Dysgonomonas TaxID=2630389 RepID=UPI002473BC7F|nr:MULTISPECIES: DUF3408 domain-containing protein [unclassified Dysgonomonas]MDH6310960.1 hypothetical protein [Dysgonomonas sp. PF1-14]MDH6340825.1 hypothetical protein [Dysgonomonas sp. PF1-16]MDH6382483.1 hypothetical protein [Dysgonomonas sp. PFB1-18]MDH6399832.1 hypothetical protein [Dysgonomonas sp. PF1-23]
MAKKQIAEVNLNEDEIRRMIAGNITPLGENIKQKEQSKEEYNTDFISKQEDEPIPEVKIERKRRIKGSYSDIFLTIRKTSNKRKVTLYLSDDNYRNIMDTLKATDGLSIVVFINNMIEHHFDHYRNDVLDLQQKIINNIFNKLK